MKDLIATGATKSIALVGISKNAGKTSVLNSILVYFPAYKWAVLSTGIDGETEDRVFKTPKPMLHLNRGCIFCCDADWLNVHGSAVTVLHSADYAGRTLYLAKAETAVDTQITGPPTVRLQRQMITVMHRLGADKVLVDGSLDRKSIALDDSIDALVVAIGASYGTIPQIIEEIKALQILKAIPAHSFSEYQYRRLKAADGIMLKQNQRWQDSGLKSLIRHEKELLKLLEQAPTAIYVPTSLTDAVWEKLAEAFKQRQTMLIVRHPQCLKLKQCNLNKLMQYSSVSCLIPFRIRAFTLNSTAVGKDPVSAHNFRQEIRAAFPHETFCDIMELL